MSIFSSMTQRYRSRLVAALRRGSKRRVAKASSPESLEQRALLSNVSFNAAGETAIFNADPSDDNVVTISAPSAQTVVIRSQVETNAGVVFDPITLQGDAIGNSAFVLSQADSVLTIDLSAGGVSIDSLGINLLDGDDEIDIQSTPQSTEVRVDAGSDDDVIEVGTDSGAGFRMDDIRDDLTIIGGGNSDTLNLLDFDSVASDTINFRDSSVTGMSRGDINYSTVESILVDSSDRARTTLNILSTASGVDSKADLTFEDADGNAVRATVTVGNTAANFGNTDGNMDDIDGDFELITNSGLVTLQVDDSGDTTGDTVTVNETSITGFSGGQISFNAGAVYESFDVRAGSGDDDITMSSGPTAVNLVLGDGDDSAIGTRFNDFVDAGLGDDNVRTLAGNDTVLGFDGNDSLDGGSGADELSGELGDDFLLGGTGPDLLEGGDGSDVILGSDGNDTLDGGFGNDVLNGGGAHDNLIGGEGNDQLLGRNGRDSLVGGAGDDFIRGGNGPDTITQTIGDGNDDIDGGEPANTSRVHVDTLVATATGFDDVITVGTLNGAPVVRIGDATIPVGENMEKILVAAEAGDDRVTLGDLTGAGIREVEVLGDAGNDRLDARDLVGARAELNGGRDDDVLLGSDQGDALRGGAGDDTMDGGLSRDTLSGASGRDTFLWAVGDSVDGSFDGDFFDGGNGVDRVEISTSSDSDSIEIADSFGSTRVNVNSTDGPRLVAIQTLILNTFAGADSVVIGDLNRTFLTQINADLAQGPDQFDASAMNAPVDLRIRGGLGHDELIGSLGNDFLRGSDGNDTLVGGGGSDELMGDGGADSISGGSGADDIDAGAGNDTIDGGAGSDNIQAGAGQDRVDAGEGNDFVNAGSGKDKVNGGDGDDIVTAGTGSDNVSGGEGDDLLFGGRGADNMNGNGGQDLMVADSVSLSDNDLFAVRREWVSGNSYSDKVDNISGVGEENTTRANGDVFLLPITKDRTVRDDETSDTLAGNAGRDLFFADFETDVVDGRIPSEDRIDLR